MSRKGEGKYMKARHILFLFFLKGVGHGLFAELTSSN